MKRDEPQRRALTPLPSAPIYKERACVYAYAREKLGIREEKVGIRE